MLDTCAAPAMDSISRNDAGAASLGRTVGAWEPILADIDGHPAGLDQRGKVAGQCRLIEGRQGAQVTLPDLAGLTAWGKVA